MGRTGASLLLFRLLFGLLVSALIGAAAYRRGSLSRSGILGAVVTGTTIFAFGGWIAGLLLIAFFISSSRLSHFRERDARKRSAAESFDKGGQRDIGQALANGGAATVLAVLSWVAFEAGALAWATALFAALIGALAAATADTWATELGVLSARPPRLITRPTRVVPPGTSGGITPAGTLAALAGASFIGLTYLALVALAAGAAIALGDTRALTGALFAEPGILRGRASTADTMAVALAAAVGGLAGSLFDSFLGATAQAMYYSDARRKETEKPRERDGTPNRPIRGWRWLNNDWVNFLATLFGGGVAAMLASAVVSR